MKTAHIRFYEELNDFLPAAKRKRRFEVNFTGSPGIKDLIESQGIPHTEIDLILVNGKSVAFKYKVSNGDNISVYPEFESFDIGKVQRLRKKPLRRPKFILDVHLGTLARYMRMCGFDVEYRNDYRDDEIIKISLEEKRAILTRDIGILKNGKVMRGYWVRNTNPVMQAEEVITRFDLRSEIKEFTRCITCNGKLKSIKKKSIEEQLPAKVKQMHENYFICTTCSKIYWRGTHVVKMNRIIEKFKNIL